MGKRKYAAKYAVKTAFILFCVCLLFTGTPVWSQISFDKYHTPDELNAELVRISRANSGLTKLHKIAVSPGGKEVNVLEIGTETAKTDKTLPAVFVAANMEGTVPISSEAAIMLANEIVKKPDYSKDKTWYILACGNPDALMFFTGKPLYKCSRNAKQRNDDLDDASDEDGPDDLDGNGIITKMRVKDPSGNLIPVSSDPRMMRKADPIKGEKGIYKLYTEGIDNDSDGKYDEDRRGGVNVGINFPHLFKFFTPTGGKWAGSESESYNLMKFIYEHDEIAMTITFGATNFCFTPPKGGRRGGADLSRIKVPSRWATRINADPDKTYSLKEVKELMSSAFPGFEVTDDRVASMLGLGAVVNPLANDLKFYKELNEQFKSFLKKNKLDGKRLAPAKAKDGSFELWSYYHLGIHSFSMDFWTLPEPPKEKKDGGSGLTIEKLEKMSNDEFIALGEEKLTAFLKESGAPERIKAKSLIDRMKEGGRMTPKMIAGMLKRGQGSKTKDTKEGNPKEKALLAYSDKELDGKGFVDWKPYTHPTLGDVEIGGAVPYTDNTPPPEKIKSLLEGQVPWVFTLAGKLPKVKVKKTEIKAKGAGIYEVKAWIENTGFLPYPTAMGNRNRRPGPVVVVLEGSDFKVLNGKKRTPISSISGFGNKTVSWLIQSEKKQNITLKVTSPSAWSDAAQIQLGGK